MKLKERSDFLLYNSFKSNFTFFMSALAIGMFAYSPTIARCWGTYAILVATIADLVLMDYGSIPGILLGRKRFYVGMALFGVTHLLFIGSFFSKITAIDSFSMHGPTIACIITLVVFIGALLFSIYLVSEKKMIFKIAVYAYLLMISMSMCSMYIYSFMTEKYLSAIGITFFMISDMLILVRETKCDTNLVRKLIWVFYPIGQLLIIFSI